MLVSAFRQGGYKTTKTLQTFFSKPLPSAAAIFSPFFKHPVFGNISPCSTPGDLNFDPRPSSHRVLHALLHGGQRVEAADRLAELAER